MNIDLFGNIIPEVVEEVVEKRAKISPFDYIGNISNKTKPEQYDDYAAWIVNLAFSQRKDTVLLANEMNKCAHLSNRAQFDFYNNILPKNNYFAKWSKATKYDSLEAISEYYGISSTKARDYMKLLNDKELKHIVNWFEKRLGGRTK